MSTPSILQQAAHFASVTSSLAFASNVTAGSFLLAVTYGAEPESISDNLNGAWTIFSQGLAQSSLAYAIAYLAVSKPGAVTVSFSNSTLPLITEISSCTLGNTSAVASGTLATNNATEITSAQVAATAGQLLLGYAFGTGSLIASANGSYTIESVGTEPFRIALEVQTAASSANYNSDFTTISNADTEIWATGLFCLSGPNTGSWLTVALNNSLRGVRH